MLAMVKMAIRNPMYNNCFRYDQIESPRNEEILLYKQIDELDRKDLFAFEFNLEIFC